MALLVPLEDYRDIARQYRGTPACGAILGLLKEVEQQRKDAGILLASLDFMQEATGEKLDPDDAAIVARIRADLSESAPTPEGSEK